MITRLMTWIYYWLALNGPDGKPSQRKILTGVALLAGVVGLLLLTGAEVEKVVKGGEVDANYVWVLASVIAGATGHSILRDKSAPSGAVPGLSEGPGARASGAVAAPAEGGNGGS